MGRLFPYQLVRPSCSKAFFFFVCRVFLWYFTLSMFIFSVFFPFPFPGSRHPHAYSLAELFWLQLQKNVWYLIVIVNLSIYSFLFFLGCCYSYPSSSLPIQTTFKKELVNLFRPLLHVFGSREEGQPTTPSPCDSSSTSSSDSRPDVTSLGSSPSPSQQPIPLNVALIIPTHNSAGCLQETLEAAVKFLPFSSIFIMDNGSTRTPNSEKTQQTVHQVSEGKARYFFNPVPNKAANLFLGALCASEFEYIMLIDDDTIFPEGFRWPDQVFNASEGEEQEAYQSFGFSICAVDHNKTRGGIVVRLQDWEYKLAGYRKYVQGTVCSTIFHHGAVGLWKRDQYLKTWEYHYGLPLGDDRLSGVFNMRLGGRMGYIAGMPFSTMVPEELFLPRPGVFWTLFKQRTFRWGVANFRHIWMDVLLFFTYFPPFPFSRPATLPSFPPPSLFLCFRYYSSLSFYRVCWALRMIYGWIFIRVFLLFELASLAITVVFPYLTIRYLIHSPSWYVLIHVVLYGAGILQGLLMNYFIMRKRPDLRTDILVIVLMPAYRFMLRVFRLFAIIVSAICYVPLYPHPEPLAQRPLVAAAIKDIELWLSKSEKP